MTQIKESMDAGVKKSACGGGQAQKNPQDASVNESLAKIKNKILVMSGKGGVGKTSTTVNLAIALSKKGFKVGIMDVDLHGPDVPKMLGLTGVLDISPDKKLMPLPYNENLSAVSVESLTASKDEAIIWRGPIKFSAIKQFIGEVSWGELDFLLIDAPPGTGDEPLTVAQIIKDAKAVVVTQPHEVSLNDVRKSLSFCKRLSMPVIGILENMSGFVCPHCNQSTDIFGSGGGAKTAMEYNLTFLGKVPFDNRMVECSDKGQNFQETYPDSEVAKAYAGIAEAVSKLVKE